MIGSLIKVLGFIFKYLQYLPTIVKVVVDAEKFSAPTATGADKLAIAKQVLYSILTGFFGLSDDDPLFNELGNIIDALVKALNSLGIFGHKNELQALGTQGVAHDLVPTSNATPTTEDVSRQVEAEIHAFVKAHPEFAPSHGDSLRSQGLPTVAPK